MSVIGYIACVTTAFGWKYKYEEQLYLSLIYRLLLAFQQKQTVFVSEQEPNYTEDTTLKNKVLKGKPRKKRKLLI